MGDQFYCDSGESNNKTEKPLIFQVKMYKTDKTIGEIKSNICRGMTQDSLVRYFSKIGLKYNTFHTMGIRVDTIREKRKVVNYNHDVIGYNYNDSNAIIIITESICELKNEPYKLVQIYFVNGTINGDNYQNFMKNGEF